MPYYGEEAVLERRAVIERANIPLFDHGYIRLVEAWGSDERVIESARMSTGKAFLGWGPLCVDCLSGDGDHKLLDPQPENASCHRCGCGGLMYNGDEKLLRRLYKKRHTTPFEMCGATFEIQAPIMVFREWQRHRTQSYSEMSARYAPLPDLNYMPTFERLSMNKGTKNRQASGVTEFHDERALEWLEMLEVSYEMCERTYQCGLSAGVPKELARLIVPVGRYSRMRASANLLNWLRFLTLRLPEDAQHEIRCYAGEACGVLSSEFPRTMALFGEELIAANLKAA